MSLNPTSLRSYTTFIQHHFLLSNKIISEDLITQIYHLLEGHTWYMQNVFNRLYAQLDEGEEATVDIVQDILQQILNANKNVYQNMIALLSERQKELLFAISKEKKS